MDKIILESIVYESKIEIIENKYGVYNPLKKKSTRYNSVVDKFIGFLLVFTFPFFVLHPRTNRLRIKSLKDCCCISIGGAARYVTEECNNISFDGSGFGINKYSYLSYLKICILLVVRNGFNIQKNQDILKVKEMLVIDEYISSCSLVECVTISNHYDRWAYYFAHTSIKRGISLVVFQHGNIVPNGFGWTPKDKLPNLNKLYCYSEKDASFFKEFVYSKIGEIYYFNNELNIVELGGGWARKILIIGSGVFSNVRCETKFVNLFSPVFDEVMVYIKPHPVFKYDYSSMVIKDNVKVVDVIPEVDLIIHYGSTLAYDYQRKRKHVQQLILKVSDDDIKLNDVVNKLKLGL